MICKKIKVLFEVITLTLIGLSFVACASSEKSVDNNRNCYAYSSRVIEFGSTEGHSKVCNVIAYGNKYYVVEGRYLPSLRDWINYLSCFDDDWNKVDEIELSADMNIYVSSDIVNDELLYVTYSGMVCKVNINTGELVYTSRVGNDLCGVTALGEGYVVVSVGKVSKFDDDDNLVATIENSNWKFFNGYRTFYQDNDKYYLLSDTDFQWKYYELDFDNSSSRLIYDPTQSENTLLGCSGRYIFDENGEYLLDIENSYMYPLALWEDTNLQPPQYTRSTPRYIGIDDFTFLQIYNYDIGMSQVVVYSFDENLNYEDRATITVGGYDCSYDMALNWAVYKFNSSQSEYRVVVEDYSKIFPIDSMETAIPSRTALLAYFNEGNTPDIYYGDSFDYYSLFCNGSLIDITQYMSEDFEERFNEITPNIRSLMQTDSGCCYRVFSSYQIDGFSSFYDIGTDVSIDELIEITNNNSVTMFDNEWSTHLASYSLLYSLLDSSSYTEQEIQHILEYSCDYGLYDFSMCLMPEMNRTTIEEYLLWRINISSVVRLDEILRDCDGDMTYVGYPTIEGSNHVIIPVGQVGVSSSTLYPEGCSQFVSCLLDGDVQDLSNLSFLIPVNDSYMHKMVNYNVDHSCIPSEDFPYALFLRWYDEVREDSVELFYEYINLADTVQYHDWGVVSMINEEIDSYFLQGKPLDEVAESLYSRLNVYLSEYDY